MATVEVVEFVTLDGVMQGFGSPDEDRDGGFEHGGWGAPYADEAQFSSATASMPFTSAYLFGRRTYEKMVSYWPEQSNENLMAAHLNATPKYIVTRTPRELAWHNSHVLEGDLQSGVQRLKADSDGKIVVLGSGVLVESLVKLGLVDGYRLFVHPLLLGDGKKLFRPMDRPQLLNLQDVSRTGTGVLILTYETAR